MAEPVAHEILNSCPGGSLYLDNESVELNDPPDQLSIYKLLICISSSRLPSEASCRLAKSSGCLVQETGNLGGR